MADKLTPAKVANLLNVSASTIRRLTGVYSDYMSEDATPPEGGRRIYTPEDVEALRLIIDLQNAAVEEPDIIARLERGLPLPPQEPTELSTSLFSPTTLSQSVSVDTSSLESALHRQADVQLASMEIMREHNASMDRHAAALERLASAQEEDTRATDRHTIALERFATAITAFGVALLILALITVAVAAGWIG